MAVDWAELLADLVFEIGKGVAFYEDLVALAGVCKSWESAVTPLFTNYTGPSRFPCLILPEDENNDVNLRSFFLLSNGGTFRKALLPEASRRRCLSTHGGWLLTIGEDDNEVKLLHPFQRIQFQLPKLDTFPKYKEYSLKDQHFITKVVLSANPSSSGNFLVMVTWSYSLFLGFCRPGDASWTHIDEGWCVLIKDITYYNGKLYSVDGGGGECSIKMCDVHGANPTKLSLITLVPDILVTGDQWFYLCGLPDVENKLLVVVRGGMSWKPEFVSGEDNDYRTDKFDVFEINLEDGTWSKIDSLGRRALFLGYNSTFLVQASSEDDDPVVKPNCIYFTDDWEEGYMTVDEGKGKGAGRDMGIYHLCDGVIEPLLNEEFRSFVTPPTWVEPSF